MKAGSGKRIIFAVTSPHGVSRNALNKATRLASATGAELELFYRAYDSDVIHPPGPGSHIPEKDVQAYVEDRQRVFESLAEELRASGLRASAHVEWDSHSDEGILREVLRSPPDLLVIESYPKGPLEGPLYGQTYLKLMESCPCPLLLVRSAIPYSSHPKILAAVDPMHAHAKPAALDDAILSAASGTSAALDGHLHLFHARVPWETASRKLRGPRWVPDVAKEESQVEYEYRVRSRVEELARSYDIATLRTHLVDGDVRDCLPAFARTESVDMVAMGVLSRSMLERIWMGDTARSLLDDLECDVLIVKHHGYRLKEGSTDSRAV